MEPNGKLTNTTIKKKADKNNQKNSKIIIKDSLEKAPSVYGCKNIVKMVF